MDKGKQNYFKYDLEDILGRSTTPAEMHGSIIQTLWSKGTRDGVDAAREFLKEKHDEGSVDDETRRFIDKAIERYSTTR